MDNVRCGLLTPLDENEKSVEIKNYIPLTEDEEKFMESEDWTSLSTFLNKIDNVDSEFRSLINNAKEYLNKTINENNANDVIELDYRGLDEEVDKLIEGMRIDLRYEIGVQQEKEEDSKAV